MAKILSKEETQFICRECGENIVHFTACSDDESVGWGYDDELLCASCANDTDL